GPPPVLLFAGDGPLMTGLRREASADVIFAGFRNQTELPGIYRLADLFVLAASREAWGLAINEAMVCGTAVIASSECGAAHDLINQDCGRLVPAGDVVALAETLPEALENSGPLGENARLRMEGWSFDADIRGLAHAIRSVT
ncbi:MAG: glycosyltransferase, partial [Rhodospirillales bacterium]